MVLFTTLGQSYLSPDQRSIEQHPQRLIYEVYKLNWLCGPSLASGSIAVTALGQNQKWLKKTHD